jgi:Fic family protein
MKTAQDRDELTTLMEPLRLSESSRYRAPLSDLALELAMQAASFRSSLPTVIHAALGDLVRSMNCYYSNLIEGHYTHPVDIERALHNDYSQNPEKRNLQLEAKAHISVQQWLDAGGLQGRSVTAAGIREIHQRFCEQLPDELLWVQNAVGGQTVKVVPGELRQQDVKVGQHVAISAGAIPRFLERFERVYGGLGKAENLLAIAAAHHRLLWIHPFLDGNGRVARLMSHAMLMETLESGSIWSVARGLARQEQTYKMHLANCDLPRSNALDGRGQLSEEALAAFTQFFLETCLDQISFMQSLVQPEQLRSRILHWVEDEMRLNRLPSKTERIMEALLYRGSLPRSEIPGILDTGERQARRIVAVLSKEGVITSPSSRAPLALAFPAKLASRWMPGLFPAQ